MNADPQDLSRQADPPRIHMCDVGSGTSLCRIELSGSWRTDRPRPDCSAALEALRNPRIQRVEVCGKGVTQWDSTLLILLRTLDAAARQGGIDIVLSGFADGVHRLLQLADVAPEREGALRRSTSPSIWERMGERVLRGLRDFSLAIVFIGELSLAFVALLRGRAHCRRRDLWAIVQECGAEALPIIALISILVGMILSFLGAVQLKLFGAEVFIADLVAIGMVREMGALMTAILMAGRTGAAFAAQLGTMQVNDEIDALRTLGVPPMEFLVLPRALALVAMFPLLTLYANVLGIFGGTLIGVFMLDLTPALYINQTLGAISLQAVAAGLIKSVVFGVLVAVSGCLQGMRCGRSAAAVGEAATAAVVNAIVYIVVADSLISIIYVLTGF